MQTSDETRGLVAWFANNPVAANLIMVFVVVVGLVTARGLPRESFPGLPPSTLSLEISFPSGSTEIAEESIALKVEQALQDLPGIEKMSAVVNGDGVVMTLEKTSKTDLDQLFVDVKARVDAIPNLPPRAEQPVLSKQRVDDQVIWVQISGHVERDVLEAVAYDVWQDLRQERDVDRVARVGNWNPEVHVEVDDASLAEHGLSLNDLAEAMDRESLIELSGRLRSPGGTWTLRAAEQSHWPSEFEQLPIQARADGSLLRLGQVASVQPAFADTPRTWMRYQGMPSIGLQIFKDASVSTDQVSEAARGVLARWRSAGRLPEGIHLDAWNDRSEQITARIQLLLENALVGMLLVFAVLALTLDLRVAFWVALGLPVAFSGAFLAMGHFGLSFNDLTTFGMIVALGIVVDDAVVIGESIHHVKLREGDTLSSTLRGVHRVAVPTIFGVLTTVAAFSMLGLVKGEFGLVFSQFALVTAGCLIFSLVESKLILPAHLAHLRLADGPPKHPLGRFWSLVQGLFESAFDRLTEVYRRVLVRVLRRRYWALLTLGVVTAGGLGLVGGGWVRSTFFPDIPGELITATLTMENSAGHGLTERNLQRIEGALEKVGEDFGAAANGGPLFSSVQTHMTGDRSGEVKVEMSTQAVGVAPKAVADAWRAEVGRLEGVQTLIVSADFDAFPAIRLEIGAPNRTVLQAANRDIAAALAALPGVRDVRDNMASGRAEIRLRLTPDGRALGLTASALSGQVQQAYLGYEVQRFQRGSEEVRVRLRYPGEDRSDLGDLSQARVRLPDGGVVPLLQVASVHRVPATLEMTRVNGRQVATLEADVDRAVSSPEAVLATLEGSLLPDLRRRYPGLHIRQEGELAEIAETQASISWVLLLALASIFALIAIPLKSYSQPILIMMAIPFGILGAILGHWIHGQPISILSFFGLLALSGIVVNDSLLLVATFNSQRQSGLGALEAWVEAGSSRLRAIALTSITTFAGLAPLILETSEHAQYLIPAAVSIAYGVIVATAITLVVLPVFQMIASDGRRLWRRWTTPTAKPSML